MNNLKIHARITLTQHRMVASFECEDVETGYYESFPEFDVSLHSVSSTDELLLQAFALLENILVEETEYLAILESPDQKNLLEVLDLVRRFPQMIMKRAHSISSSVSGSTETVAWYMYSVPSSAISRLTTSFLSINGVQRVAGVIWDIIPI